MNGTETNAENFAAIYEGTGTNLIYDAGIGGTSTQAAYLVEYDGPLRTSTGAVVAPGQEIAAADLAAGRLVRPFSLGLPDLFAYYIVTAPGAKDRPKVRAFRDWLREEADRAGEAQASA